MEKLNDLKSMLRSLVVSSPVQMDVRSLLRDYRAMAGHSLPFASYGYKDPIDFLKERFSDSFLFQGHPSNPTLILIVPQQLKHMDAFVRKQKSSLNARTKLMGKRQSIQASSIRGSFQGRTERYSNNSVPNHNSENSENQIRSTSNCDLDNRITASYKKLYSPEKPTVKDPLPFKNNPSPVKRDPAPVQYDPPPADPDPPQAAHDDSNSSRSSNSKTSCCSASQQQLEELKDEVAELIKDSPGGIWCTNIIKSYRERYGRELNYSKYGFTSVVGFVYALRGVDVTPRPGSGDWLLRAAGVRAPPDAPPTVRARLKPRAPRAPSAAPAADDALPGVEYDPAVFPADCLHFTETLPPPPFADLRPHDMFGVLVGEVYSPSHFWLIRLGRDYDAAMEDLMDDMTEYYESEEGRQRWLAPDAVRVGHYCSSVYEGDWHRSLIVRIVDAKTVKVRHVDYGTVDTVRAGALKPLLRRYGALPAQGLRARLGGVRPPAGGRLWPQPSSAALLDLVRDRSLVADVLSLDREESVVEVLLMDTSTERDVMIGDELVRTGHADARVDSALRATESYLFPRFEALESGATPNYGEIMAILRNDIALDCVDDYRRHVPSCLPPPPLPPQRPDTPPSPPAALRITPSPSPPAALHITPSPPAALRITPPPSPLPSPPPSPRALYPPSPSVTEARPASAPRPARPPSPPPPRSMVFWDPPEPQCRPPPAARPALPPPPPLFTKSVPRPLPVNVPLCGDLMPMFPVINVFQRMPPAYPGGLCPPFGMLPAYPPCPPPPGFGPLTPPPPPPPYRLTEEQRGARFSAHDSREVKLPIVECEVYKAMAQRDPEMAHRFMMEAVERALQATGRPGPPPPPLGPARLNPEASEFRSRSMRTLWSPPSY